MNNLLASGSVLAAFFAGGVALFAPCCIVFLAPGYLALAAKNHRWRLLPLSLVFTAGLALVLVPITLGISLVAATIARFHGPLYYAGGALMLALAVLALSGRTWTMPRFLAAPDTSRGDSASFFAHGVFSGIASSCCAPVLAGVMTLSVLSGSPAGGALLGLAYVFGMMFPLLVMALAWDRLRLGERGFLRARTVRISRSGPNQSPNRFSERPCSPWRPYSPSPPCAAAHQALLAHRPARRMTRSPPCPPGRAPARTILAMQP